MLEQVRPDLVLILTPSGSHYSHSKLALQMGCNVLVEKPAAMHPFQAQELVNFATISRLMYGVAFQNRLNPAIRCLREALLAGRFGRIVTATVRLRWCRFQSYYEDGWHGTWSQDGGVINQQAVHHLDALNWLLGPVSTVSSISTNRVNQLEAEDTLVAALTFASGALGTIEATTAARPQDFEASLSVVGENGLAVVGGIALNEIQTWSFVEPQESDAEVQSACSQDVPNGYGLSHIQLLQATFDSLLAGVTTPPIPVEDTIPTIELVHALYRSNEERRWVSLFDKPCSRLLGR